MHVMRNWEWSEKPFNRVKQIYLIIKRKSKSNLYKFKDD